MKCKTHNIIKYESLNGKKGNKCLNCGWEEQTLLQYTNES